MMLSKRGILGGRRWEAVKADQAQGRQTVGQKERRGGREWTALEYLKNGGPLIKGNVASENLDQWFKDILHDFTVKNIEHMSIS